MIPRGVMLIKHYRSEKHMILQLEHVTKNFRDQGDVIPVLTDINFSISAGDSESLSISCHLFKQEQYSILA